MTQRTSILPPRKRLVAEYKRHASNYDHLSSNCHLDEWLSASDLDDMRWHGEEMEKLAKVLDALEPGWDTELSACPVFNANYRRR